MDNYKLPKLTAEGGCIGAICQKEGKSSWQHWALLLWGWSDPKNKAFKPLETMMEFGWPQRLGESCYV